MSDGVEEGSTWQKLLALRAMSETTGLIYEDQVYQLKVWGRMALAHVENLVVAVALPWTEHEGEKDAGGKSLEKHHFVWRIEFRGHEKKSPPKKLKRALEGLDRSVKSMLGDKFTTRVRLDGVVIFERKGRRGPKRDLAAILDRIKDADRTDDAE